MLTLRSLALAPGIEVQDVRCCAERGATSGDEVTRTCEVVLPRRGVFVRHLEGRDVVADANHALLFRAGERYRVSHPASGGDACTVFRLSGTWLEELGPDGGLAQGRDRVPTPAGVELLHRKLLVRLRAGGSPLGLQEIVLEIVRLLVEPVAAAAVGRPASTREQHAAAVRRACTELASTLDGKLDLPGLAHRVGISPFHLSRIFRAHTGTTLHRYHERLRLRAGLQRVLEGERDLTRLALELGFAHHSHFTNRFRGEFGLPPSACRALRPAADS